MTQLGQFTVTNRASDVVADPVRGQFWLSAGSTKELVQVGLAERGVIGSYPVAYPPESLTVSPDGKWLYAALPTQAHDYYWFDGHNGYIAEIALNADGPPRQFEIAEDPYSLIISDSGVLTISDGSGQWTSISSYLPRSTTPSNVVSSLQIRQESPIVLHPGQKSCYSITTDESPVDITHWNFDGENGGVSSGWGSPYWGTYPMYRPLWIQPDGGRIFTAAGTVFKLDADRANDLVYLQTLGNWPISAMAFDAVNKALFAASGTNLYEFSLDSLEAGPSFTLPQGIDRLYVQGTNLVAVAIAADRTDFTVYANPAAGAASNQPPNAQFTWTPASPTVLDTIQFSAMATTDDGPKSALEYRWDWNGDGQFDTDFSTNAIGTIHFDVAGTKQITLEVKDAFGAASRLTQLVNVALASDPGTPVSTNIAFALPFATTFTATDPVRPYLYASDTTGKRLVRVNLTNGFIDREFRFDFGPERMAVTPDGQRLYVVIPAQAHSYYGGQQKGFVAEIDLASGTRTQVVDVDVDPFDIVATDDGLLVISDGSNQWTTLTTHDAATGRRLGSENIYMGAILGLGADQRTVYQLNAELSPSDLYRFTFDASGAFIDSWNSPYHGDHPTGKPYPNPAGDRVITAGGAIYTSSSTRVDDLLYISALDGGAFEDLAYDQANGAFFAVRSAPSNTLTAYNLDSLQTARVIGITAAPARVGLSGPLLAITSEQSDETDLEVMANPMLGARDNNPPAARFSWSPTSPTTLDPIVFDPSTSTDDGGYGNLDARWDWNGDGQFDTPFAPAGAVTHRFNFAGTFSVILEVRDQFGAVSRATNEVTVSLASNPGSAVTNALAGQLGFIPADVAFDPVRPFLYATDKTGRRLARFNLTNGVVEREFRFELAPEHMAITPNGSRLFVSLLTQDHSSYWFDGQNGAIAEFDLAAGVEEREFPISIDPYDLLATDDGWLIVSGGSGQWTTIRSFDTATGEETGRVGSYQGSTLTLAATQDFLFASVPLEPSNFHGIALNRSNGQLTDPGVSPDNAGPKGFGVWALPDGHVATSDGGIYSAQQRFVTSLGAGVVDLVAEVDRGQLFTVNQDGLRAYNIADFTLQSEQRLQGPAAFLGRHAAQLFVVYLSGSDAYILSRNVPSRNAAEDLPPRVGITTPLTGSGVATNQPVIISADAEDDDGSVIEVDFLTDGIRSATAVTPPWTAQLSPLTAGVHTLRAIATDNWGVTQTSAPVVLQVSAPPTVALSALVVGTKDPATVLLSATAADSDGTVAAVIFRLGEAELGRAASPPYQIVLTNVAAGVYTYTAVAVDNSGVSSPPSSVALGVNLLPGDYFADRIQLAGNSVTYTVNTTKATREPGEPLHALVPGNHSIWWQWTPPASVSGTLVLDTAGSSYDTVLAVYTGASLTSLSPLASNDNASPGVLTSRLKFFINGSVNPIPLIIAADGRGDASGDLDLNLTFISSTSTGINDRFAQRQALPGLQGAVSAFNTFASAEFGEPAHAGNRASRSLWWSWTAPANGRLTLSTSNSTFDTVLAAYIGSAVVSLAPVASNDDAEPNVLTSEVDFRVQAGVQYQIAVDGYQGQTGFIELEYAFEADIIGGSHIRPDGGVEFWFNGASGETLIIEASTDLIHWTPIQTNQAVDGSMVFPMPSDSAVPRQYFRAKAP